jgi:hypothetical protein
MCVRATLRADCRPKGHISFHYFPTTLVIVAHRDAKLGITLVMPLGGIAFDGQIFSFDVTLAA